MVTYDTLQQCIHPVIFRTGIKATPVSTWGTGFMLGTQSRVFFVSARHVIGTAVPDDVCVLSPSGKLVPLKDSYTFHPKLSADDWADVVIHEVPVTDGIRRAPDTRLLHLALSGGDWKAAASTSRFYVAGFPNDYSGVDYDANEVFGNLVELQGAYVGPAAPNGFTHRLTIPDTLGLSTFNGLSGSPVLMLKRSIGEKDRFVLTGMAIQGTTQAGTILFVDRAVISTIIESKSRYEKRQATAVEPSYRPEFY